MDGVTVLVSSYDGASALWRGWCHFWHKFWPDCPWPVRFVTNHLDAPCGEAIKCGPERNWTAMMRKALAAVDTPSLLFTLDDYWLASMVNGQAIADFAKILVDFNVGHIRLQRSDPNTQQGIGPFEPDPRLFVFWEQAVYRASLQAALWNRAAFQRLLVDGESPWEFETNASFRSKGWMRALCVNLETTPNEWNGHAFFPYHNIVSMGQWCGVSVADPRMEGMVGDFIARYG
jgi:hypothetical protein